METTYNVRQDAWERTADKIVAFIALHDSDIEIVGISTDISGNNPQANHVLARCWYTWLHDGSRGYDLEEIRSISQAKRLLGY